MARAARASPECLITAENRVPIERRLLIGLSPVMNVGCGFEPGLKVVSVVQGQRDAATGLFRVATEELHALFVQGEPQPGRRGQLQMKIAVSQRRLQDLFSEQ